MYTSDAVTRSIRVHVTARYSPQHSDPTQKQWFFLYTVEITNDSSDIAQLLSRHWIITDANKHVEEVRGQGVVGKQPILRPGESFRYTSGCPLSTPFGSMRGTYHMVTQGGEAFDIEIAAFALTEPYIVH